MIRISFIIGRFVVVVLASALLMKNPLLLTSARYFAVDCLPPRSGR